MTNHSEEEIATVVVEWLQAQGWEVFQEVQPRRLGIVADLVARRASVLWIIEVKAQFGLRVMQQAYRWIQYGHFVSVAVPHFGRYGMRSFSAEILRRFGIGALRVDPDGYREKVRVEVVPEFRRRVLADQITKHLREEHKTFAKAGNSASHRFTPFQSTCLAVKKRAEAQPGITMKEMMDGLEHHYAGDVTARTCIRKWAEAGKIPGVRLEREGRQVRFFPENT